MSTAPKKEKQPKKPQNQAKPQGDKGGAGNKAKQGKAPKQSAQDNEDVKRDQKLQAILLADSFNFLFRPISLDCPKVLLPLVNVPMLDYTIEFLAQNGVEEVFVFCVSHADKIEEYIKNSRWPQQLSIRCINSASCVSAGDALRELDGLNIVRSDPFILISGDVISNVNLKKAIAFHKEKRKEDINNIMTVVLKKVQKNAGAKPLVDDLVVGMNRKTSQIVLFDDTITDSNISIPLEILDNATELAINTDFLDCNVDICSPELMLQFSDNFDYQDIRRDFIRNEVCNFALGKHVYGYVIQNEYAARVQDPRTYHSICRDIVTRWTYPLVPDVQLLQETSYSQSKNYVYKEQGTKVSRTAEILEEVVLGKGTTVGESSKLSRAILGRGVTVGNNVKILDSHIWINVLIEDNVSVTQSIICDGAIIRKGATIPRGCIIGYGVEIGPNVSLPEFSRITNNPSCQGSNVLNTVTYEIKGKFFSSADEELVPNLHSIEPSNTQLPIARSIALTSIGCVEEDQWKQTLWNKMPLPLEDDDYDDDIDDDHIGDYMGLNDNESDEDHEHKNHNDNIDHNFTNIVADMVSTGYLENHPADSILMEIKGFKFAQNKTYSDCLRGILNALFGIISKQTSTATMIKAFGELIAPKKFGNTLITSMTQDDEDQVEMIISIEDFLLSNSSDSSVFKGALRYLLQVLYDADLLSEEAILDWSEQRQKLTKIGSDLKRVELYNDERVQAFLQWMQEEDDEEDDEEESGDECDDDDDEEKEEDEDN